MQTWFTRGESLWYSKSLVEKRPGIGTEAVNALVAGRARCFAPGSVDDRPRRHPPLGLNIAGGIATVDMSSEFAAGGSPKRMRLAQLVYTLTQFPSVKGVRLRLDGKDTTVFSGDGIVLPYPMRRSSFADLLPAIVVETPGIGDLVAGPIVIKGTANVFEANVSVEIVSGHGKALARTFTTATCGTAPPRPLPGHARLHAEAPAGRHAARPRRRCGGHGYAPAPGGDPDHPQAVGGRV